MLLARMAEAVYWAGRHLERAEGTARIVQVHTDAHVDMPVGEDVGMGAAPGHRRGRQRVRRAVLRRPPGPTTPGPPRRTSSSSSSTARATPRRSWRPLTAARENLRTARPVVPREAWEACNNLWLSSTDHLAEADSREGRVRWLRRVIAGCQCIHGILLGTMSRDEAMSFLVLGQNIERADLTTRVLDVRSEYLHAPRCRRPLRRGPLDGRAALAGRLPAVPAGHAGPAPGRLDPAVPAPGRPLPPGRGRLPDRGPGPAEGPAPLRAGPGGLPECLHGGGIGPGGPPDRRRAEPNSSRTCSWRWSRSTSGSTTPTSDPASSAGSRRPPPGDHHRTGGPPGARRTSDGAAVPGGRLRRAPGRDDEFLGARRRGADPLATGGRGRSTASGADGLRVPARASWPGCCATRAPPTTSPSTATASGGRGRSTRCPLVLDHAEWAGLEARRGPAGRPARPGRRRPLRRPRPGRPGAGAGRGRPRPPRRSCGPAPASTVPGAHRLFTDRRRRGPRAPTAASGPWPTGPRRPSGLGLRPGQPVGPVPGAPHPPPGVGRRAAGRVLPGHPGRAWPRPLPTAWTSHGWSSSPRARCPRRTSSTPTWPPTSATRWSRAGTWWSRTTGCGSGRWPASTRSTWSSAGSTTQWCDPVELRADSLLGVPGLVEVVRRGRVAVLNPLGLGDPREPGPGRPARRPGPGPARRGAGPAGPESWWCGRPGGPQPRAGPLRRPAAAARCEPAAGSRPGPCPASCRRPSATTCATGCGPGPGDWVGQEILVPSTVPTVDDDGALVPRPVVLRTFAVADETADGGAGHGLPPPPGRAHPGRRRPGLAWSSPAGATAPARTPGWPRPSRRSSRARGCRRAATDAGPGRRARAAGRPARPGGRPAVRPGTQRRARRTGHPPDPHRAGPPRPAPRRRATTAGPSRSRCSCRPSARASGFDPGPERRRPCPGRAAARRRRRRRGRGGPAQRPHRAGPAVRRAGGRAAWCRRSASSSRRPTRSASSCRPTRGSSSATSRRSSAGSAAGRRPSSSGPSPASCGCSGPCWPCPGCRAENMERDPAWLFLDGGRRLERAQVPRPAAPVGPGRAAGRRGRGPARRVAAHDLGEPHHLPAPVRVRSCTSPGAIDLLVYDVANPRSVLFQLDRLVAHLAELPKQSSGPAPGQRGAAGARGHDPAAPDRPGPAGRRRRRPPGAGASSTRCSPPPTGCSTTSSTRCSRTYFAHERLSVLAGGRPEDLGGGT